jgi:uncharacterized protein YfbU (UPF0304 family)
MKLSKPERWILSNQYRILELIDKENANRHRLAQEALDDGYEVYYDWLSEHIYDEENTVTKEESDYIIDVLDMFDFIQRAYDELGDKTGIEPFMIDFPGFDGNNDAKFLGFAEFFCKERRAFESLRKTGPGGSFNSHMPTHELYSRMLAAWRESKNKRQLTKVDLIRITQAAVHPDHRK